MPFERIFFWEHLIDSSFFVDSLISYSWNFSSLVPLIRSRVQETLAKVSDNDTERVARTHERTQERIISTHSEFSNVTGNSGIPWNFEVRDRPQIACRRDVERKLSALSVHALNFTANGAFSRSQKIDDRSWLQMKARVHRIRALKSAQGELTASNLLQRSFRKSFSPLWRCLYCKFYSLQ